MASIIKRKKKYSVVYYYTDEKGDKRQKWESYDSHSDALKRKIEVESDLITGNFVPPSNMTVKDLLNDYIRLYGVNQWAMSTYEAKISVIANYINPLIGDMPIQDVTPRFVDQYYLKLQKTKSVISRNRKPNSEYVSPGVIRHIHKTLRSAFKQAVKWEMLKRNPFDTANLPKVESKKRDIWTADMIKIALDNSEDPKLYLAINLAFACSLRIGEILGLTWDNVNIEEEAILEDNAYIEVKQELTRVSKAARQLLDERDIIFVFPSLMPNTNTNVVLKKPKTESSIRRVWLPKTVAYILRDWKCSQDELKNFLGSEYRDYNLVVALPNGRPCEGRVMEKSFIELKKKANLPNVVFHSLRHSSTTYKLKLNNGDLKATQGDTGHAQIDMITDVYAHILDEDRKVNAQKFEAAFYSKRDLRNSTLPESKNIENDLSSILTKLQESPDLTNALIQLLQSKPIS